MRFDLPEGVLDVEIGDIVIAGWTGRDGAGVRHHIEELALIGVPGPSTVPLFYRVAAGLMTRAEEIQVLGAESSGEVEPLIVRTAGGMWLGLGSDHTDRGLESVSVAASKQACAKPVAAGLWPWDEVEDHLDAIEIRSWIGEGGARVAYQDGTLAAIRPLGDLLAASGLAEMALAEGQGGQGQGAAMLCGTTPVLSGGIRPARHFAMEMRDPVRDRTIRHAYRVRTLPVVA